MKRLIDKKSDCNCSLFDGHKSFPDIECIHCGKKYRIRVADDPKPISQLYLHDVGLTVKETESELRIAHEDIEFTSVISKSGTWATLGQATPTWKYIYYLKNNSLGNERELYDFFDKQGIRCFVGYNSNNGAFKPEIRTKTKPSEGDGDWRMERVGFIECHSTRQEAEATMFAKAHEILELKPPKK